MKRKLGTIAFLSLTILIAFQLYVLRSLDYSGSAIAWNRIVELLAVKPNPNFRLGDLYWDVERYSQAPELDAHRTFFNENCRGRKGIDAAGCLSRVFVERVPFGAPSTEIFNTNYSPRENLLSHLDGESGHCVTFSAMTVNSLLSVGIPARFLQTLPIGKQGHNIIEVWDDQAGWVAYDSLNDSAFSDGTRYLSAADALNIAGPVKRVSVGGEAPRPGHLAEYYDGENPFAGRLIYPEPWMYTRIGDNPNLLVRNRFAAYGKWDPKFGLYQSLLRGGIMFCLVSLFLLTCFSLVRVFMRRRVVAWQPAEISVAPNAAFEEV